MKCGMKRKPSEVRAYFDDRTALQKGDMVIHKIKTKKGFKTVYCTKVV